MSNSSLAVVVDSYGLSDVGLIRTNNEDSFLIASPLVTSELISFAVRRTPQVTFA